jgi:iron complex outermembrane receptor protein
MYIQFQVVGQQTCTLNLTGTVSDLHNKMPLSGITIYLKEIDTKVTTDSLGRYVFTNICQGKYTLLCATIPGFKPIKKQVELTECKVLNLQYESHTKELGEVIIYSKRDGNPQFKTLDSDVIQGDELEKNKGANLGELVKAVPGVSTLNTGNSISKPVIHGMHSNRLLIVNNGVRQEGQQWGTEHAPEVDPFIAGKVTVVKGANSVMYGSDAIAGVILVDTKALRDTAGIGGEVNLVGNSNGRAGIIAAFLEGNSKRFSPFSWRVQGTLKQQGSVHSPDYVLINTGNKESNFSVESTWKKNNYGIEFFYSQFNTKLGIFGASHIGNLSDLQRAFTSPVPLETGSFTYTIGRPYQEVEHELTKVKYYLNGKTWGKLSVTYARQYNFRNEYDKHRPLNDALASLNLPDLEFHLTTHLVDVLWNHPTWKNWKGTIGVNGMTQANTYRGRMLIPSFENQSLGVFWVENWHKNHWNVEFGARQDWKDVTVYLADKQTSNLIPAKRHFERTSGNIGLSYATDTTWKFFLNIGTAWRAPSVSELYSNGLHHGAAAVEYGTSTLNEEQAYSGTFTLKYSKGDKIHIEISPYYNMIQGFIYRKPLPSPVLTVRGAFPGFVFTQSDATLKGVDFFGSYHWSEHIESKVKASLLRAWNRTENDWLILMPSDRMEVETGYHIDRNRAWKHYYVGFTAQYIAKQTRVPANADFAPPPGHYWLCGLSAVTHVRVSSQLLELGLNVTNLFNQRYRDYLDRFRYFADAMGTNVSLRVKYRF